MTTWKQAAVAAAAVVAGASGCVPLGGLQFQLPERTELLGAGPGPASRAEAEVLQGPAPETARANLRYYASMPHMAGTEGDLHMAQFTQRKMHEFGLEDSRIEAMDAYLSYPVSRSLSLVGADGQVHYQAPLIEGELKMDPTSSTEWRNMSFLGYGPSGHAVGQLVYANYGRPEDFDELKRAGVSVKGKVVLTRYGECFRGLKAMNAQHRGAAGVLIYSDPQDDGYAVGDVYPEGPWRPSDSIQRGSAQFNSLCPGDPGRANVQDVCGYTTKEVIPQIPVLPLSYGDAIPLLRALRGPVAPAKWQGGLKDKLQYRLGPSSLNVDLATNNTFTTTKIWNVITTIQGELDTPVVLGNHRDAWVFGAADPNSGSAVMLEVAKSLGRAVRSGWKPKRTIIIGSWSGEEYGLLGSTGWGEANAKTILKDAVAYINTDVGVSGDALHAAASPSLGRAVQRAAAKVTDPKTGQPMSERWDKKIGTLGSGSDYTVFLDFLGIPSIDLSFAPSNGHTYGVYHSIYDSYTWLETQVDPEYKLHAAMARLVGALAVDFADAPVLPIDPVDLADALDQYVHSYEGKVDTSRLHAAVEAFRGAAAHFQRHEMPAECTNRFLGKLERAFLDAEGLPDRMWFKHVLQAPGKFLGYAPEVIPGIQQWLTDGDKAKANAYADRVAGIITNAARTLSRALLPASCDTELDLVASEL